MWLIIMLSYRYILQEKKRGAALNPVTNFHVRNGAVSSTLTTFYFDYINSGINQCWEDIGQGRLECSSVLDVVDL